MGYIDVLFAGNALATHDIEQALFGTSLGVYLDREGLAEAGHEHHLRAINRIRRAGGIRPAVQSGVLTSGVMFECVRCGVDFLLAGSIRDDGPLPDVITDVLVAQQQMREKIRGVTFCLMIATTLHSIAVGNLLALLGQGGLRRHQPLDRHQAHRSRLVPDRRPGDRRGAVHAGAGRRPGGAGSGGQGVPGSSSRERRPAGAHVSAGLLRHRI